MKKVVYSCLFVNNKRRADTPLVKNKLDGWDYVMFTNVPDKVKNTGWTPITVELINNHTIYTARHYKWLGHKYLLDYTFAIYVDAHMSPAIINWETHISKLSDLDPSNGIIYRRHPHRNCVYKECDAIANGRKDTKQNMNKVIDFLKQNNMPRNYGLIATGVFIRHLKNDKLNKIFEEFYDLMLQFSYRDQSLLTYILWKYDIKIKTDIGNNAFHESGKIGNHIYV